MVRGDKFSLEGVEVVKERHLERWKNKLRRGLLWSVLNREIFQHNKISYELLVCTLLKLFWQWLGSKECLIQHLVNMLSFVRLMNQFRMEVSSLTQIADVFFNKRTFIQSSPCSYIGASSVHFSVMTSKVGRVGGHWGRWVKFCVLVSQKTQKNWKKFPGPIMISVKTPCLLTCWPLSCYKS